MARTVFSKTAAPGPFGSAGVVVSMVAADPTNGNEWTCGLQDFVIVQNTDTASHTVTILSSTDSYGRKGDITADPIAAGAVKVYGPFQPSGWQQSDNNMYSTSDSALVKFGVISLR